MRSSHYFELLTYSSLPALLISAWAYLLNFPWDFVFYAVVTIEICIFLTIFSTELHAAKIDGAPGWILTFSFFIQMIILIIISLARIMLWLAQAILSLF